MREMLALASAVGCAATPTSRGGTVGGGATILFCSSRVDDPCGGHATCGAGIEACGILDGCAIGVLSAEVYGGLLFDKFELLRGADGKLVALRI